ncbi:MAG: NUDIX hydrolase [Pseudomonadota bacterium]
MARFCSECGTALETKVPAGDNRERQVCAGCGHIDYVNPTIIVSCLAYHEQNLVWVKRAQQPQRGFWVIPAGFLECDESLEQGALRELFEETSLTAREDSVELYTMGTLRYTNEVYIVFRAELENIDYTLNHEVLDVGLFQQDNAPWGELAYPVMESYIRRFYTELQTGQFKPYLGDFSSTGNITRDLRND